MRRSLVPFLITCAAVSLPAGAQRQVVLDKPEAVLSTEFTQIRGVRELRDGRVVISDRLDQGVVAADFATQRIVKIGRAGPGPDEYRQPTNLFPLANDSTLLIDEGNSRIAVIGPDLRIHRSQALLLPGFGVPMAARGIDAQGRYYVQIPYWVNPAGAPRDTVAIVRFDPRANRVDTVTRIKGITPRASSRTLGLPYVLFAPQDAWAVVPDGRVVVARSADYHVEWITPGSQPVRGSFNTFDRIAVTFADRLAHVQAFARNSSTSGRDDGRGGASAVASQTIDDSLNRDIAQRQPFAETHPPFASTLPRVGPDGTFWLERSTSAGQPSVWDVFAPDRTLTTRVRLPAGRTLACVGARSVYAIATDEDGLQKLERYRRP
jgi:hypothetical protein